MTDVWKWYNSIVWWEQHCLMKVDDQTVKEIMQQVIWERSMIKKNDVEWKVCMIWSCENDNEMRYDVLWINGHKNR